MSRLLCWLACIRKDSQAMRRLVTRWPIMSMVNITHRLYRVEAWCSSGMHPEEISSGELNADRVGLSSSQLRFIEMNLIRDFRSSECVGHFVTLPTVSRPRQRRCAFGAVVFLVSRVNLADILLVALATFVVYTN